MFLRCERSHSKVALELLRRKNSIVAASTRAFHYRDETKAQREFNNMTIQQRGKFERETSKLL